MTTPTDRLPSPIVPLDVAVIDSDLLWRSDLMNAARPLYADDFVVVGEALDRVEEEAPCVLVIGPTAAAESLPLLAAAHDGRPFLRVLVVDPDDGGAPTSPSDAVDAVVSASATNREILDVARRLLDEARKRAAASRQSVEGFRETQLIAVTGPKAGEGATVVAVHLALALQVGGGRQVTLVETDPTFGDIPMRLGLEPHKHTATDQPLPLSPPTIRRLTAEGPAGLQVFVPPQAHHELHTLPPTAMPMVLDTLQPGADVIIIDARLALVLQADLLSLADRILVVTTSGLTNLKNASITAGLLDRADHVAAVINRHGGTEHKRFRAPHQPEPKEIERAIGLPVVGVLPQTEDVAHLPDQREDKDFVGAVDQLAGHLLATPPPPS